MAINESSMGRNSAARRERSGAGWIWPLVILGVLVLAVALFAQEEGAVASEPAEPQAEATIENIVENPQQYAGQTVTLTGQLDKVISPTAIQIKNEGGLFGIGSENLLVLGREAFPPTVSERTEDLSLQVTGPVRLFNRVEVERDWGIDLDDELFTVYEGKPVVVAQSLAVAGAAGGDQLGAATDAEGVVIIPEGGTAGGAGEMDTAMTRDTAMTGEGLEMQPEAGTGGAGEMDTSMTRDTAMTGEGLEMQPEAGAAGGAGAMATGQDTSVTLSGIFENTEEFYGDTVNVTGYVAKLVGKNALSLSPTPGVGGDGILVVGKAKEISQLKAGSEIKVNGIVRSFNQREYESELGLDLDDALFGEWDQDPSIRAMSIQRVEAPTATGPREPGRGGSGQEADDQGILDDEGIIQDTAQ